MSPQAIAGMDKYNLLTIKINAFIAMNVIIISMATSIAINKIIDVISDIDVAVLINSEGSWNKIPNKNPNKAPTKNPDKNPNKTNNADRTIILYTFSAPSTLLENSTFMEFLCPQS